MFELAVEHTISAGHQLRGYEGKCEHCHGHNWRIRLEVAAEAVDALGLVLDFGVLKRLLEDVLDPYDHVMLNELPDFRDVNPSSEHLARLVFRRCRERLAHGHPEARVIAVTVWESPRARVRYHE
mgnify:CR=1 FL=1